MAMNFNPYHEWLDIPEENQPPNYYELLGLEARESSPHRIKSAADRQMARVLGHQSSRHANLIQPLLDEIAGARECLLDPHRKSAYDAELPAAAPAPAKKPKQIKKAEPLKSAEPLVPAAQPAPVRPHAKTQQDMAGTAPAKSNGPLWIALGAGALLSVLVLGAAAVYVVANQLSRPSPTALAEGETQPAATFAESSIIPSALPEVSSPKPPRVPPDNEVPVQDSSSDEATSDDPLDVPVTTPSEPTLPTPSTGEQEVGEEDDTPTDEAPPTPPHVAALFSHEEESRLSVPSKEKRHQRAQQVNELFPLEKNATLSEKIGLAEKLIELARSTKDDPAGKFVLLNRARVISSDAGAWQTAAHAIDLLDQEFAIDGTAVRIDSLREVLQSSISAEEKRDTVRAGIDLVDALFREDRFQEAAAVLKLLVDASRRSRDADQIAALELRQKMGSQLYRDYVQVQESVKKLKADPADKDAALAVGKFYAFAKGDWNLGLPLLAAGSNASLAKLAQQEMDKTASSSERKKLADAWLKLAESSNGLESQRQRARALMWYERVQHDVEGLAKIEVSKRIESIGELPFDGGLPLNEQDSTVATVPDGSNTPSPQGPVAQIPPEKFGFDIPNGPVRQGEGRVVMVRDKRGRSVVAKVHVQVGSNFILMMPDGKLEEYAADKTKPTSRPFVPATKDELAADLVKEEFKGFQTKQTRRYLYVYNTTESFATVTSRILETMTPGVMQYSRAQKINIHDPEVPLVVVMYRDDRQFRAETGAPDGVAAFYNTIDNRVSMYEKSGLLAVRPDLAAQEAVSTIAHEGVHQILANIGVQQRLSLWPMWISEGAAEFFSPTSTANRFKWKGAGEINDLRMFELEIFVRSKGNTGGKFVTDTVEAARLTSTGYASAWALTHYLAKNHRNDFFKYVNEISQLQPLEGAFPTGPRVTENSDTFEKHFGADWATMEQRLIRHLQEQPYSRPFR